MAGIILPPVVWIFSLLVCVFSSIIPDIDSRKSKIYRITADLIIISVAVLIISYSFGDWEKMLWVLVFWFILSLIRVPLKHRGFIHTIWAGGAYAFAIGFIAEIALGSFIPGFFAFLGYFSHLALDKKV